MKFLDLKQRTLEEFREWTKLNGVAIDPKSEKHFFGQLENFLSAALTTLEQGVLGEVRESLRKYQEGEISLDQLDTLLPTPKEIKEDVCPSCHGTGGVMTKCEYGCRAGKVMSLKGPNEN